MGMGPFGGVWFSRAAGRAVSLAALVAGLPRRAAAGRVHGSLIPGQCTLPLGGAGISDAAAAARGCHRATLAHEPGGARLARGTAGFVLLGSSLFASEARFAWLPAVIGDFRLGKDPSLDVVDWTSIREDFGERGLLDRPNLVVAAQRWSDAGKLDYALSGRPPVICLGPDAHQYGLLARRDEYAGADVLIVTRAPFEKIIGQYWFLFDTIEPLGPATVLHAGRPALRLNLFLGHRLHKAAEECCAS